MAVSIGTLNAGNMTVTLGSGGSSGHADTWYKYENDTEWRTVSIQGDLNNFYDEGADEIYATNQIPDVTNVVAIEIGTDVTGIRSYAFKSCSALTSVTIPTSVMYIGNGVFLGCGGLTSVTFLGKTMEQVLNIEDEEEVGVGEKQYPWGIGNTSIINVA